MEGVGRWGKRSTAGVRRSKDECCMHGGWPPCLEKKNSPEIFDPLTLKGE